MNSFLNPKDGKTIITGSLVISADGKTRTVTVSEPDANGKRMSITYVYDRQ
jgi:hypothetical protein